MPYPNEHSCRLADPGKFDKFNRKNCEQKHDGKCIDVIYGIKEGKSKIQALRYPKDVWSAGDAKSHCKDKEGTFEAAGESDSQEIEEVGKVIPNEFEEAVTEENDSEPTSRNIERRYINDIELRLVDDDGDGENVITGYAAVFNKWSEDLGFFKEKIEPGTFKKTIAESDIRALINHDPNLIIGRTRNKTLKLWEDDKGLGFEVKLPETSYAADLIASIKRKDITQNSFGFKTILDKWSDDGKKRILKEAMLFDISPVTFPAYKQTTVKMRLHELGIDFDALNMALIRAERGVVTNSDVDLFHSTIEILKRYLPVEEEPIIAVVEDSDHSEDLKEPDQSISTQIRVRLADMVLKKYLGVKHG